MKPMTILKLTIDLAMTAALLLLMAYALVGEEAHEWIGAGMFVLVIAHQLLNISWYRGLFRGKYTIFRAVQTAVNLMVLLCMIGLLVSGVILSRYVFAFLPPRGSIAMARMLHMLAAYWGFVLMSVHLGLHWNMILAVMRGPGRLAADRSLWTWPARGLSLLLSGWGVVAFIKHDIASYMFLQSHFVFFDFEQPLALFLAEYLSIMFMFACAAYYSALLLRKFLQSHSLR